MLDVTPGGWTRSRARSALHLIVLVAVMSVAAASVMAVVCFAVLRVLPTVH